MIYRLKKQILFDSVFIVVGFTLLVILMGLGSYQFLESDEVNEYLLVIILYFGPFFLSLVGFFLYNRIQQTMHDQQIIQTREKELNIQRHAVDTLREQRHDMLNELALISSYIQLGRLEAALRCVELASANLSDKYNYCILPYDAWLTVIANKQQEALTKGIDFRVSLDGDVPTDAAEQRLLPRLVGNLLDNAFEAASKQSSPVVSFVWKVEDDYRLLYVKNTGPELPQGVLEKILASRYTSKEGGNHGWGLRICQKIACELGTTLECTSDQDTTCFSLTLAKPQIESGEERDIL